MDKTPIYPGAIPLDTNWLQPQRNTEIALGFLMQAAFGTSTVIDGLVVAQTTVPSMAVSVGPGSIITATTVDTLPSGFGSLAQDNVTPLVKIGINTSSTTMSVLTAPGGAGQSQNWLVEAQFIEADGSAVVLPYYNASNPTIPYTGPANAGTTNNTARTNRVQLQWKGGTAATTGTQNTPTPDSGWFGVAIVTVANGQATITNANITPYSLAPFVPTKLSAQRIRLNSNLNIYVNATGGSDSANSGLSASSPFLTLQRAWNYIVNGLDLNGYNVVVNVANGTYSNALIASGAPVGLGASNYVLFLGNASTPSNCIISTSNQHCIQANNGASISVSGFKLVASGSVGLTPSSGLLANQGLISVSGAMEYGSCAGQQIWATSAGQINVGANYTVSGGAQSHMVSQAGSILNMQSITVTLTGTPAFSTAFANCSFLGFMQVLSATYSGSATGPRYAALANGVINTNGGGATYFPGNAAGSSLTGQYQ